MQKITRAAALLLVTLAVILAIVAFGLSRHAMQSAKVPAAAGPNAAVSSAAPAPTLHVVVAGSSLSAGEVITNSMLRLANVTQPTAGSYTTTDAIVGDVPLVDIPTGTTITSNLLARGLATELKPGERALAVPVDELAGAGNRIQPGDYVDVFLSLKAAPAQGGNTKPEPTQTRLLLSRMRVLTYGSQNLPEVPKAAAELARAASTGSKQVAKTTTSTQNAPAPRTAVLAVPLEKVDRLLLGVQDGKLSLALRHPADHGGPDHQLFPPFRPALAPLARLSGTQRQLLDTPENRAYAGLDGNGLAARVDGLAKPEAAKPDRTRRASNARRVEIIRGTEVGSP